MRFIFIILFCIAAEASGAQDWIAIANDHLNDKNYLEAKNAIDQAFQNDSSTENPRAWYTKARIYHEILNTKNPSLSNIKEDLSAFVEELVEGYNKTKQLTQPGSNLYVLASNQLEILYGESVNQGVKDYKASNFKEAVVSFEIAKIAKPTENIGFLYTAQAAKNDRQYDLAIENFLALKKFGPLSKEVYNEIILASQAKGDSYAQQLNYLEQASVAYPTHIPFIAQRAGILVKQNRLLEAETILKRASKSQPNNPIITVRQADIYDRLYKASYINGDSERSEKYLQMAIEKYEKFISQYPNDFAANFNYSVMLNEQANRYYVRINLMEKEEFESKGRPIEEQGHVWTRKALPYMEKAQALKPKDEKVILALKVYYDRLEMTNKLKALNGEN